jgi:hypothetical protein
VRARASSILAIFSCFWLAGFACLEQPPAVVNVYFNTHEPVFDNTLSSAGLEKFKVPGQYEAFHDGFTRGGIREATEFSPQFVVTFDVVRDPVTANTCLSAEKIDISVDYKPKIHIASEYKPGSCRYTEISRHEMQHVNTDILAFEEFLPKMRIAAAAAVQKMGVIGPLRDYEIMAGRGKMLEVVGKTLQAEADRLRSVVRERQLKIDTRQEYLRLSAACQGEPIVGGN